MAAKATSQRNSHYFVSTATRALFLSSSALFLLACLPSVSSSSSGQTCSTRTFQIQHEEKPNYKCQTIPRQSAHPLGKPRSHEMCATLLLLKQVGETATMTTTSRQRQVTTTDDFLLSLGDETSQQEATAALPSLPSSSSTATTAAHKAAAEESLRMERKVKKLQQQICQTRLNQCSKLSIPNQQQRRREPHWCDDGGVTICKWLANTLVKLVPPTVAAAAENDWQQLNETSSSSSQNNNDAIVQEAASLLSSSSRVLLIYANDNDASSSSSSTHQ